MRKRQHRRVASVEHAPGWTRHDQAFKHLLTEIRKQPIHAALIISDAVELRGRGNANGDVWDELCKDAMRLRRHGCRLSFIYKGTIPNGCPFDRAGPYAEQRIRELAADNEGTILNPADPEFTNKLRKVATDAALRAKGDVDGARALLPDLRAVPFDLVAVGDEALVGKCGGSADGNDSGRTN